METLKYLIELIGPTAFVAIFLTYWFNIRQKKFDIKEQNYRKTRIVVSDLLMIWREFSKIEAFLNDSGPMNTAAIKIPKLRKRFLDLDDDEVKKLVSGFEASLVSLKEVDVSLFYELNVLSKSFYAVVNDILNPIISDEIITPLEKRNILLDIMKDVLPDLEDVVIETSKRLPRSEAVEIERLINEYVDSLKKEGITQLPVFLINLLNKQLPIKSPITPEELNGLSQNETVQWLISKLMIPVLFKVVFDHKNPITFGLRGISTKGAYFDQIIDPAIEIEVLKEIHLTTEEDGYFVDNKRFYKLLMGIAYKFTEHIPYQVKKKVVEFNRGDHSVKQLFDDFKRGKGITEDE